MVIFQCQGCEQIVYFENVQCMCCSRRLGFLPERHVLSALEEGPDGTWTAMAEGGQRYVFCANAESSACNWLIAADSGETFCVACRHNRVIPDLTVTANIELWRKFEAAKHRLIYSLIRLKLPLVTRAQDAVGGLVFDILAEWSDPAAPPVVMGHANGVITLDLKEANDARREHVRQSMGETYRTLLGHFRHESGHYFWDKLVRDGEALEPFRTLFGDEREDYGAALRTHYDSGPPAGWQERYISAYASAHPWEDFAEMWAHYLHIVDTLEMAFAFGLSVQPAGGAKAAPRARFDFDPYTDIGVDRLMKAWVPLALSVNAINRCMGEPDLYPFVLSPLVVEKLGFVHALVHGRVQGGAMKTSRASVQAS